MSSIETAAWRFFYVGHPGDFRPMATSEDQHKLNRLREAVNQVWNQSILTVFPTNDDGQWKLIEFCRQTYVYPDYLNLVGEPAADDYTRDGDFTLTRKSRLLLIGVFHWKSLELAKYPGMILPARPREELWVGNDNGWYVLNPEADEPADPVECFFYPYNCKGAVPLGAYLMKHRKGLQDDEKLFYVDDNIYNCSPENLQKHKKYGRPMRCIWCYRRVTPEMSVRIEHDGRYQRFCMSCVETFGE